MSQVEILSSIVVHFNFKPAYCFSFFLFLGRAPSLTLPIHARPEYSANPIPFEHLHNDDSLGYYRPLSVTNTNTQVTTSSSQAATSSSTQTNPRSKTQQTFHRLPSSTTTGQVASSNGNSSSVGRNNTVQPIVEMDSIQAAHTTIIALKQVLYRGMCYIIEGVC